MLPPISDVTHITLAHCDAVGRGYPPHQFSVTINIQIVTQWRTASIEIEPNSLVLKYDAVMHEVRNHRATVRFLMQNRDARQIAEFGFFDAEKSIPLDLRATGLE